MSHGATNWAIQQRGLKPTTKIVLWHLCDRHNPDHGCFPSQDRLAADCEISRSTLNLHLDRLEAAGLLRREPRIDPATRRQLSTRYILGFEPDFAQDDPSPCPKSGHGNGGEAAATAADEHGGATAEPCPESGHGAVSGFCAEPCPKNCGSRVRKSDTNPVREPLREPVKEEEGAQARVIDFGLFWEDLLAALGFDPDGPLPGWWQGQPARAHVRRWRDNLGLSDAEILAVAAESRQTHPSPPDGPKALDRAMQRAATRPTQPGVTGTVPRSTSGDGAKRRRKRDAGPRPSADELAAFYAELVNSDRFLPTSAISTTMRDAMLSRGLVTADRLRERGVT